MAACPRCGTQLKEDYGMSQCPGCGAFSFVDMDGNAVIQEASAADAPVEHAEPGGAASPMDFGDPIENVIDVPAESPSSDVISSGGADDFKPFDPFDQMATSEPESSSAPPASVEPSSFDNQEFEPIDMSPAGDSGSTPPSPSQAAPAPKEPSFGPADDPLNINDFANSEVSAAKDGPLLFRVLISGIDTREIRESIREVLQDPRFAWDDHAIFSKIAKGVLAINGLSPVKASILITRIKRLPVQIRWEQYAIAQGQP